MQASGKGSGGSMHLAQPWKLQLGKHRHRHKVYPISSQVANTFTDDNTTNADLDTNADIAPCLALTVIFCLA